ncbi:MAG: hypothetical protein J5851_05535 [Oscillospiraceae bacterium]|nr:hypothetical protein [Oscillospiraceae bacterium]
MKKHLILWGIALLCSCSLAACSDTPQTSELDSSSLAEEPTTDCTQPVTEATQPVPTETNPWDGPSEIELQNRAVLSGSGFVSSIDEIRNIYPAKEIIPQPVFFRSYNLLTFLYEMDENFPIEYYVTPENGAPYCVYRLDTGSHMFVFFNEEERSLGDVVYFFVVDQPLEQEDFSALQPGMTLVDVEAVDPGTKLIDSLNVCSLFKHFTLHMVKGGFMKITYEGGDFLVGSNSYVTYKDPSQFIITDITFIPNGEPITMPDPYERYDSVDMHFSVPESDLPH